jgi:hypothetical protein
MHGSTEWPAPPFAALALGIVTLIATTVAPETAGSNADKSIGHAPEDKVDRGIAS